MEIFINGKNADITLDTEKTLGDVLSGIELWLSPTGNRIQEISVDGKAVPDDALPGVFGRELQDLKKLELTVSSWGELAAEALGDLAGTCGLYANAAFDERPLIAGEWEKSAAARFLASDISDMYALAGRTLSGDGLTPEGLVVLVEERIREIAGPGQEIAGAGPLVSAIAQRMEELPLDMQTGKDARAAETMQRFGGIGEKLFRIFFILKSEGLSVDSFIINEQPARVFMDEFNAALKELSAAYENRDTVLAGDIAEYELAPRLLSFHAALKDFTASFSPLVFTP